MPPFGGGASVGPSERIASSRSRSSSFGAPSAAGAPFGVGAYYPADVVTISGTSKEFSHAAASGGKIHNYFCPQCGSTVYWKLSNLPALIGVAVGAMANPKYPAPVRSVEEQTKHDWVHIDGAVEHFQQNYLPKNSN